MTTPSSPPISMEDVRAELGVGYPISLNQSNVLQLAGFSSAPISLLDLLGKSSLVINALSVQQYAIGADPNGDPYYAYGFSDGGGYDGVPGSNLTFGSLQGNNVSTYTTNAVYSYEDVSGNNTCFITRLDYGAGHFSGWTIKLYSSPGNVIATGTLTYQFTVDATQTYFVDGQPMFLTPYAGQGIYISIQP